MFILILIFNLLNPSYEYLFNSYVPYQYSNFKSIETEHFIVSYPSKTKDNFFDLKNIEAVANITSNYMEKAYNLLVEELLYSPKEKISVIVLDIYDFHNGYAYPFPDNIIYIFTIPPGSTSDLAEYDNYLWTTCVHELTHIISLNTNRSYIKLIRKVFGNIINVNSLWPMNLIEGQAVYNETKFSSSGRGRSSFYHALIRTSIYENTYNDIYKLKLAPYFTDLWPRGRIPYFYGYLLFEEINNSYDKDMLGKISYYNSASIPYIPNISFIKYTNKDISELWDQAFHNNYFFYKEQINKILTESETKYISLFNSTSYEERNPTYSPDKAKLAYYREDPHSYNSIIIYDINNAKIIKSINAYDTNSIAWLDNNTIIFNSLLKNKTKYYYNLVKYSLKNNKTTIIKNSDRIHYFTFYNNFLYTIRAKTAVFIINKEQVLDNNLKIEDTLYSSNLLSRLSLINVYKDKIIFSEKNIDEAETIKDIDNNIYYTSIGTIKDIKVFNDIYFIDDTNSVFNIYKLDYINNKTKRLTNTVGSFLSFSFKDSTTITASLLHSYGIKLVNINTDSYYQNLIVKENKINFEAINLDFDIKNNLSTPYTPKSLPNFWLPILNFKNNESIFGFYTFHLDATFRNYYSLKSTYSSLSKKPNFDFSYISRHFLLEPYINYSLYNEEQIRSNTLELGFKLPLEFNFLYLGTDYINWGFLFEYINNFEKKFINNSLIESNRNGFSSGIYFQTYNNTPGYFYYPEKGFLFLFKYIMYPEIISDNKAYEYKSNFNFIVPFIYKHQLLKFNNTYNHIDGFYAYSLKEEIRGGINLKESTNSYYALNFDYIIPLYNINYAQQLYPLFLRKAFLAITFDYIYYSYKNTNKSKYSYGVEFNLTNTLLYHVFSNFKVAYYRFESIKDNVFIVGFVL